MTEIRDTSRILLGLAEAKEGVPVTVVEEPQLSIMAALRVARGESPSHFILYHSSCAAILDYLICFHSAMLHPVQPGPGAGVGRQGWRRFGCIQAFA